MVNNSIVEQKKRWETSLLKLFSGERSLGITAEDSKVKLGFMTTNVYKIYLWFIIEVNECTEDWILC